MFSVLKNRFFRAQMAPFQLFGTLEVLRISQKPSGAFQWDLGLQRGADLRRCSGLALYMRCVIEATDVYVVLLHGIVLPPLGLQALALEEGVRVGLSPEEVPEHVYCVLGAPWLQDAVAVTEASLWIQHTLHSEPRLKHVCRVHLNTPTFCQSIPWTIEIWWRCF